MQPGIRRTLGLALAVGALGGGTLFWSGRQAQALSTLGRRYVFASMGVTAADTLRVTVANPVVNSATGNPNVRGTVRVTFFDADGSVLDQQDRTVRPGETAWADFSGSKLNSDRAQVRAEVSFRTVNATPSPFPLAIETPALELVDTDSGRTFVLNANPRLIGGG